jgi:RecA/RadA recombinase
VIQKLLLEEARIVEVFGFSGVGKSAIITQVANYLAER